MKINDIIWLNNAKMGYKLRYSHLPTCVSKLCMHDANNKSLSKKHAYNTRYRKDPYHPLAKSKRYNSSFLVKSVTTFNDLPETLKKIVNLSQFVKCCKNYHFLS